LDNSEEVSNTPEGVLVRLKNKIRLALGLDTYKLKLMIDRFVIITFNGINSSKTHFAKVNIFNEITKDRMTVKVFFKFLRIINIKSIRISVTLKTAKDVEYTVFEDVNLFTAEEGPDE
jgi:hypothetical protein